MPPPEMEKLGEALPSLVLYSVPALCLVTLLHKGKLPLLRFRRRRWVEEAPLFSGLEVLFVFLFWFLIHVSLSALMSLAVTAERIDESEATVLAVSFTALATCAFLVHAVKEIAGQPLRSVGLTSTYWGNLLPAAALCFCVLFPLSLIQSLWMLGLHEVLGWEPRLQDMVALFHEYASEKDVRAISFVVFSAVVVAPLVEEPLFRGLLFGWLRTRCGVWGGAILSSVIFAGVHFTLFGFVPLVVLGVILAYVYQRTGSLYPAMVFHAVFNATTLGVILLGA